MRGQQSHGCSPAPFSPGGVCPRKRWGGCFSPDTVLLLILQDPARAVIIFIYDQVSICVVARVKVGDHAGRDPQAPHYCRKRKLKSHGFFLWIQESYGFFEPREATHLALPGPVRSCWGYGLVILPTSLPTFLSSSLGLIEETLGKV